MLKFEKSDLRWFKKYNEATRDYSLWMRHAPTGIKLDERRTVEPDKALVDMADELRGRVEALGQDDPEYRAAVDYYDLAEDSKVLQEHFNRAKSGWPELVAVNEKLQLGLSDDPTVQTAKVDLLRALARKLMTRWEWEIHEAPGHDPNLRVTRRIG